MLFAFTANEPELHSAACWLIVLVGACVAFVEHGLGARAPYGRHSALMVARWYGPTIDPRAAWCFQESWAVIVPIALLCSTGAAARAHCLASPGNLALLGMFVGHYAYRSVGYPLRMPRGASRMPIGLCALATAFMAFNGYVQGRAWTALEVVDLHSDASLARLGLGAFVWAAGLSINLQSDALLRGLRRPSETGYSVPRGGAFEYVSCANYLGEIVEWCGYALASGGRLPAVAWAFFTAANLVPRAKHHHEWYRDKFDDYPKHRKALVPFLW